MRFGWVAVVAVLLAGCGSNGEGNDGDLPSPPTAATTPLPGFDPETKHDAQKALDGALDGLMRAGYVSFDSKLDMFGVSFELEGDVDIEAEASEFALHVRGDELAERAGGDTALEYRILGTHVYGSPNFGPFNKCWFDYGDFNPMFAGDEAPWLHVAVGVVTDARALGFDEADQSVIIAEVPAVALLYLRRPSFGNSLEAAACRDDLRACSDDGR